MSQGFTFGFSHDDAETSEPDVAMADEDVQGASETDASLIAPQLHSFDEILASLPSSLSYTFTSAPIRIPRRELFDIRAQLMSETDPGRDVQVVGLNAEDIEPGVYEGGFKTWECAVDLARYVLGTIDAGQLDIEDRSIHILELGAGTALPSAALLHRLLQRPLPASDARHSHTSLIAADYNASVLSLATGPNLFLSSLAALDLLVPDAAGNSDADLEPSPALLSALQAQLRRRCVSLAFLSGAWGASFVTAAQQAMQHDEDNDNVKHHQPVTSSSTATTAATTATAKPPLTLLLASETIYEPRTQRAFVDTLLALLRAAHARGEHARAYVAAKRVYFGVGGGVVDFCDQIRARGARVQECWASESDPETRAAKGVGRCVLLVEV